MMSRRVGAIAAAGSAAALGLSWYGKKQQSEKERSLRALQPNQPVLLTLHSKQWVTNDAVQLRFDLPTSEHVLGLPVPGHVMVVDAATNYRPYSPITIDRHASGFFDLLVRRYPRGEFSSQLARMEPGDQATFLGPCESRFQYKRGMASNLGIVAAGTGITPVWQVIQAALADPDDKTCISLVYASHSAEAILLKPELDRAAAEHPDRLRTCFVVSEPSAAGGELPLGVRRGRIDEDLLLERLPAAPDATRHERPEDACQLLICGPEGMLRELCGHRARDGGVNATGPAAQARHPALGGTLWKLGYRANQVVWL